MTSNSIPSDKYIYMEFIIQEFLIIKSSCLSVNYIEAQTFSSYFLNQTESYIWYGIQCKLIKLIMLSIIGINYTATISHAVILHHTVINPWGLSITCSRM